MAQTPIKLGFYDNIGKTFQLQQIIRFFHFLGGKNSTFSQLSPRLPKARGVRCAPSLKAVCAVCGGSEVPRLPKARGVRCAPSLKAVCAVCGGSEVPVACGSGPARSGAGAAAASCAVPWGDVSVEGGCGRWGKELTPPKTNMSPKKGTISTGNTSPNHHCSGDMLVFSGVQRRHM